MYAKLLLAHFIYILPIFFSVTNQYSAAMHYYLQAGTVCSDYFTKPVPPDVYTDQVLQILLNSVMNK